MSKEFILVDCEQNHRIPIKSSISIRKSEVVSIAPIFLWRNRQATELVGSAIILKSGKEIKTSESVSEIYRKLEEGITFK